MSKPVNLSDLLDGEFADGYAQFKELVEYAGDQQHLPIEERLSIFLFRLVSVAMIEGLNRSEDKFETPPVTNLVHLWRSTGIALAMMNLQGFQKEGLGKVRREMREHLLTAYNNTIKSVLAAEADEAGEP
ncbi:hypothetical protein [Mycoplana ramosa]|uniref:Uncharacterized protein n=1 Tax=Mycoplana ramosa TaxID=40837 RepID=A0ABW3YWE8_MYCRA